MYNSPLYDAVERYAKSGSARLHMPGHKGAADIGYLSPVLPYDITELSFSDNLYIADGVIGEAERLAAKAFGSSETCFCAGGASLAIYTMLAFCPPGSEVLADRRCHRSVLNAIALLDLCPEWVYPYTTGALPKPPDEKCFERARKRCPGAAAAIVTSPDYYGQLLHPAGLCLWAREHNINLFWDNSHGTHLAFLKGDLHPSRGGASIVVDSAHKTLPVLTGGAYLHLSDGINKADAKEKMALFGSSSPSYLILASLDRARAVMEQDAARLKLLRAADEIKAIRDHISSNTYFSCLDGADVDPLRLTIDTSGAGMTGYQLYSELEKAGVFAEMADERFVVMLGTGFEPDGTWERVQKAVAALGAKAQKVGRDGSKPAWAELLSLRPKAETTPREAMFSKSRKVAVSSSVGQIAARALTPYPPGVPIIMPGERIDSDIASILGIYYQEVEIL